MSTYEIPMPPPEPLLIAADELADLLKVSKRTLWRLRSAKHLPEPVRLGNSVRWRIEEIRQWIAAGCPKSKPLAESRKRA